MIFVYVCYSQFTGYDLGNQMLHAKGTISSMYPADGGQIRTEKYQFEQGNKYIIIFYKSSLDRSDSMTHINLTQTNYTIYLG